ncbi:MAG TPA: ABC transporter substrate-binding protein [Burkholderiales bacterium]
MVLRRRVLLAVVGGLFGFRLTGALGQGKTWTVGFLAGSARPANGLPPAALRQALAQLGFIEGKNVAYEGRWAEAQFDRLPRLAAELVERHVDVIVSTGWLAANAAKHATAAVPIVAAAVGDAVESGLVASLSRPNGNLTGISEGEAELSAKRLQLLKEAVPNASRLAVLWNQEDAGMTLRYRKIDSAARALGVTVMALGVREPDDFESAFAAIKRERPQAIFLVTDALTSLNRQRVIEFAAAERIPAMYEFGSYVQDGGLMSYGPSLDDSLRRAAYYIDRILKGAKPGQLAMEQPTRFYFVINLKTAKSLGLTIPPAVLIRADQVVQ